jgi:hypothetical protein
MNRGHAGTNVRNRCLSYVPASHRQPTRTYLTVTRLLPDDAGPLKRILLPWPPEPYQDA